jgi:hypothetical protein
VAADCSTDVTDGLNAWLATVPDGSTIDLAGGCYLSNGTVLLDGRHNITIDGHGATVRASSNAPDYTNRAQLALNLGSGITVRDLTLRGSNHTADCAQPGGISCYRASQEWDHNLRATGTDGVLIDGVSFEHAWGDAVALSPGGNWDGLGVGALMTRNVTVQNSSIDTTGRMAFSCTGCASFTAQDNTITNIGYHVVDVEVEAATWSGDVTLLRNTYTNAYLSLLSATTGGGTTLGPFVVRDNVQGDRPVTCQLPIAIGQAGLPYGDVTITGNDLYSINSGLFVYARSATITGNRVIIGTGGCGDAVTPGSGTTGVTVTAASGLVSDNTFVNSSPLAKASVGVRVCGNSNGGAFDQPQMC